MATECVQVLSQDEKQKSLKSLSIPKNTPPVKNICQPFTLRLILGVPILKEDSGIIGDLSDLFSKFTNKGLSENDDANTISECNNFWAHIVIGVNCIVKRMEDSARDSATPNTDFSVVFLDFAWLNSQLGHHLAHLCSMTPHTSLVAVSPPGKLSKMLSTPGQPLSKVACFGIRPLTVPYTGRLPMLREIIKLCSSLTGKSLPPDPSTGNSGVPATPQYVPILPKPIGLENMPQLSNFLTQTIIPQPGTSQTLIQKTQMTPKPSPRPAVRHIPADDWLTYKLDHTKLYKCGSDISKELEDHSLYIHDVADIWALYPRHFQKMEPRKQPVKKIKPKRKSELEYTDAYIESPRRLTREERRERFYRKQMQMKRNRNPRRSPRW